MAEKKTTKTEEKKAELDPKKLNLWEKLLEISKEIDYLQKKGQNVSLHYSYVSEADVKTLLKPLFDKWRVIFMCGSKLSPYPTKVQQGKMYSLQIEGTYKFINVDNPTEREEETWTGEGTDGGDKGMYKAITAGVRHILMNKFLIPTGDDPEADKTVDENTGLLDDEDVEEAFMKKFPGTTATDIDKEEEPEKTVTSDEKKFPGADFMKDVEIVDLMNEVVSKTKVSKTVIEALVKGFAGKKPALVEILNKRMEKK